MKPINQPVFDQDAFAAAVAAKVRSSGLSFRGAADACRVDSATLNRIANGKKPDVETYHRLMTWMGRSFKSFVRTP